MYKPYMAKHKKGNKVNGWVNFNKPLEMTSTQAVGFIKRIFNAQKAGHGGTLDPLATGVLPIALGEATKTMQFSLDADKTYNFTIKFGSATDTDDMEGEVIATSDARPIRAELENILPKFTGLITQTAPKFSALKIDGQPAYKLAREGKEVKLKVRKVTVHSLKIKDFTGDTASLSAHVSKGTYVRSLARDIGEMLGCYGHVIKLERTQAGVFTLDKSIAKETLDKLYEKGEIEASNTLLPTAVTLADIPVYVAAPMEVTELRNGKKLWRVQLKPGLMKVMTKHNEVVSLVEVDENRRLKIIRNFN